MKLKRNTTNEGENHVMPLTIPEIKERLKQLPELDLLELLEITSEELVDRFSDLIEDKADILEKEVE
jgi:hypothetical protein